MNAKRHFLLLILCLLFVGVRSTQAAEVPGADLKPAITEPEGKIDPLLHKQLESNEEGVDFFVYLAEKADLSAAEALSSQAERGAYVYETLRLAAETSQADLRALLTAEGFQFRPYYITNTILVYNGTLDLANGLAGRADVAQLLPNRRFQLEEPMVNPKGSVVPAGLAGNIAFVNADDVWAMGIDGTGIVLAANDTGLEWTHPALIVHYRGFGTGDHNYNWWDPTGTYPDEPHDFFGHGTHVSGTMVGDDGFGEQIGMAPGAQIIHCKAMDDGGGGLDSWFLECFEWDLAPWDLNGQNPRPDLAPDSVNNSWGYGGGGYPIFQDAINNLQSAGILVEASAGNEGPECSTLRSPGDYTEVLTTGSVAWDQQVLPGALTWFSSRGPSSLTADYVPDLMAPGENIRSSIPGGGYENWDGTSMAGPHVVGLVALMWEANPGLEGFVEPTLQVLASSAIPLSGQTGSNCGGDYVDGPNNDWGFGTIDSLAAVNAAMTFGGVGTLSGTVTDANTNQPLEGVAIHARLNPDLAWKTTTNSAGVYTRLVFSGTYTVTASLYGYYTQVETGVAVMEDQTTIQDFALQPAPVYTVSGTVTDALSGWPLYARIDIAGYPYGPVLTDPETGLYSIDLAAGVDYTFTVYSVLGGYLSQVRGVGPLTGNQTEDFSLEADAFLCSAPGYQPGYAYFEPFESDDGGYTIEGFGSWQWGVPTSGPGSAHSGTSVWATNLSGNYFDNESATLTSPSIDLSAFGGQDILLEWWQWLVSEEGFDYAAVEVSNDSGGSWTPVFGPVSGNINGEWTKYSIYLGPAYAVSDLRIRFSFQTDGSVTMPGYYIDDVGVGVVYKAPSLYAEDFEASDGGYAISGLTSWEWGTPTRGPSGAHSGVNVWATNLENDYHNNEEGAITSPVIDLTGADSKPMLLSWWQWLQTESGYDFASVDVYNGTEWIQVYSASGPIDWDWYPNAVYLGPEYAIPDFQIRFGLLSDSSVTYPGFYVDDVAVDLYTDQPPSVSCDLQAGGLVLGYIQDANTGSPLNGALVSSPAGIGLSIPTPEDPAIEDGFYTVFAPEGQQPVAASYANYATATADPIVPLNGIVRQDLALAAPLLTSDPSTVTATVELGSQTAVPVDLMNLGGADTEFTIGEKSGEFVPAGVPAVWIGSPAAPESLENSYLEQAGTVPEPAMEPYLYTLPPGAWLSSELVNVLLLAAGDVNQISGILSVYPDLSLTFYDARIGTPTAAELQAYDVVVLIANNAFADPVAAGDALADYIDAGGAVVQTVPTFFDPGGNGWGIQGRYLDEGYSPFIGYGDWFTYANLGDFDPTHPIMEGVVSANDYFRQMVDLAPDAEWVASWTDDELAATLGSVVALNTFISDGSDWSGDVPLIVHNSILFAATGQDVAWLTTEPITGTLPAYGTVELLVTVNAGIPEITQPGSYQAALIVKDGGPYGRLEIPVSMQVTPPASWGRLSGNVTSLGYCDAGSEPLEGAAVEIHGLATTATDAAGDYVYWMDSGMYTVTVSGESHLPQIFEVWISAGQTTVQDAALRLNAPCAAAEPDSMVFILEPGTAYSDTLTLSNDGGGALDFTVLESPFDLTALGTLFAGSAPVEPPTDLSVTGPASARMLDPYTGQATPESPLTGWFSAADHPEGAIRYAFAQCAEQPESYYVFSGVSGFDFGISRSAWRFDAATNSWTPLADLPAGYEAPSAACYQGRIYVLGGGGSFDLQIYSIASDTWSFGAPLPRGVEGAAVGAWDGRVFMIGGDDDFYPFSGVSDEVNIYDIASDTWIGSGADMPVASGNAGFVQFGPYLYITGGWGTTAPDANVNATQRYDLDNNLWEVGPQFLSARADFALAATADALYAIGGDADGGAFFDGSALVEKLDLTGWPAGSWIDLGDPLPKEYSANQAGFCTQAIFDPDIAEIWSVGGLDPAAGLIEGRTLFRESPGERCYSIYTDVPWLTVEPTAGTVPADWGQGLVVSVDTAGLIPGTYTARIALVTNDPGQPVKIVPVTLMVGGPFTIYLPEIIR